MKNIPLLIGTLVVTLGLIVGIAVLFSKTEAPKKVDASTVLGDGRLSMGPADAKVTIVEFSDLQCPACKSSEPFIQEVVKKYPDKVRFVYRHFPLVQIHLNSQAAAEAAEAAAAQGKFWQMHDFLFEHQTEWAELSDADFKKKLIDEYLGKLEIDKNSFMQTIDTKQIKDNVAADVAAGTQLGVDSTPTFFVNGQQTPAPQLLSTVESALNSP